MGEINWKCSGNSNNVTQSKKSELYDQGKKHMIKY